MMGYRGEKVLFGFLGAITAVIIGLGVFSEIKRPYERIPASSDVPMEYSLYPDFID